MTGPASRLTYDVVVVGSGPNGLVAACVLAEAGRRVLVVEAADRPGGGLRTEELTLPGFHHDVCSSVHPLALASPAFRALRLGEDGLRFAQPPTALAHPLDGMAAALLHKDIDGTAAGLGRDGRAWRRLAGTVAGGGPPLVDALLSPLDLPPRAPLTLARYGAVAAWPATALGRTAFRDAPARALLAGLAAHAILPLTAPGTAGIGLLLGGLAHGVGWPLAVGGSGAIADALVARLRANGGELETGVRVDSLRELPPARDVVLDLTPRQVVEVAGDRLPPRYRERLAAFRYGPGVFKVDWALDGPVPWSAEGVASAGTVHLGGTAPEVAHGEAEVARGRLPERPFVLFVQASVADRTRAPEGRQTGWAYCHVPNGCDVDRTAAIEAQVERFAPGFRDRVLARHVMGPAALEAHNANEVGGDIAGGAGQLWRLVARPVVSAHPWRTPVEGLYLCSASTPPGGGVHGMGGWHAAREVLARP